MPGGGLPSYPHPRLMPDFWEFPTVSMGLGADRARSTRPGSTATCTTRRIKDTSPQSHVWAFLGDGEMDEPESLGAIGVAAREELDNLTFVINCNLQRLDGPVRGNGKIIQELESYFRGAGWNVIKVDLGPGLGPAARPGRRRRARQPDEHHAGRPVPDLRGRVAAPTSASTSSAATRGCARWSSTSPTTTCATSRAAATTTARSTPRSRPRREHVGQPTVILAHTIKGWTLGTDFEGTQRDPPDEEADEGRAEGLPRPALPGRSPTPRWRPTCRRTTTRARTPTRSST